MRAEARACLPLPLLTGFTVRRPSRDARSANSSPTLRASYPPSLRSSVPARRSDRSEQPGLGLPARVPRPPCPRRTSTSEAWPKRKQDPRGMPREEFSTPKTHKRKDNPRGMPREEFSTPKTHKRKVVCRPLPSGQPKGEPELLQKEVPHSSGKTQRPPKRSFKNEPRLPTPQSDRGTPDSLPDSGPADEYRVLRRKYLLLEEDNFTLDKQLGMAEEEVKTLEDEKFALLDQLVVLEGLVNPSQLQSQRRP